MDGRIQALIAAHPGRFGPALPALHAKDWERANAALHAQLRGAPRAPELRVLITWVFLEQGRAGDALDMAFGTCGLPLDGVEELADEGMAKAIVGFAKEVVEEGEEDDGLLSESVRLYFRHFTRHLSLVGAVEAAVANGKAPAMAFLSTL